MSKPAENNLSVPQVDTEFMVARTEREQPFSILENWLGIKLLWE